MSEPTRQDTVDDNNDLRMVHDSEIDDWKVGEGKTLFGDETWFQPAERKRGRDLENYVADIAESVRVSMDQAISILTPWFFSNMPQFYYQMTPRDEKVRDLHAVITGHIFESKQKLQLWNRDRTKTTFLAPGTDPAIFADIAGSIHDLEIKNGYAFTSNDQLLLIASFFTSEYRKVDLTNAKNKEKLERARAILKEDDPEKIDSFLFNLDDDTVIHATHSRLARLFRLYSAVRHREDVMTHLIPKYYMNSTRFDVAYKKMNGAQTLLSVLALFERYGFLASRFMVTTVDQHTSTPVGILTFIIQHESGEIVHDRFVPFLKLNKAVKTLKWVDTDDYDQFLKPQSEGMSPYSLNEINLIRATSDWVQIFLSKINPYYYSVERIRKTYMRHPRVIHQVIRYFRVKFDPREHDERDQRANEMRLKILSDIEDIDNRIQHDIMMESMNFMSHILKTNYYFPRKTGLSFRLDPDCLNTTFYPNKPFGFFYLVGRDYRAFHVRFRDTARGGLRILMPKDTSQYEGSLAGLFDEVIGLSYAQQQKNKDIPEGGAKAVLLLTPDADRETSAVGAVDSLLNLITVDPITNKLDPTMIDYFGQEEYVYLGPDENCTNELIEKFIDIASNQGYRYANAFMSSKPKNGINHKEFGVTSEGVNVYLENMLGELGINPRKQTFTIKMTGGPDGDVAGNELKILHREYGKRAKVVAIGDGYGAAYDPNGLNWKELLRLVTEGLPINNFSANALSSSKKAFVISADSQEHIKTRNNLYAKVVADIFIPAGGRPYTVNSDNWQHFLQPDGTPSAKAVIEGANIFFTDQARDHLQEHGLLMFKDSSANKCGVISSSFEILSSLVLSPDEFIEIKTDYVEQVIKKLHHKADAEARLILREYHERGMKTNLVELSKIISAVINRVTDLVAAYLVNKTDAELREPLFDQLILAYAPAILSEKYAERLLNDIPRSYRSAIISADIAARLVYTEGVGWLEHLPNERIVSTVLSYMEQQRHVMDLLRSVRKSKLKNKDDIAFILETAGARTLTHLRRSKK